MLLFSLLLLCTVFMSSALQQGIDTVLVTFSVPVDGKYTIGFYWAGVPGEFISKEKPYFGNSDSEHLITALKPGEDVSEQVRDGHSIIVRSADFSTRVRITVSKNRDNETNSDRPYTISLVNLSIMDREG